LFGKGWDVGIFTINSKAIHSSQVFIYWSIAAIKLIQSLNHELYCDFQQYKIESKKLLLYLLKCLYHFLYLKTEAAKHNYSKTTQNMVLNCKWQIHLHIENGKYIYI
jgi:hypothetical protein